PGALGSIEVLRDGAAAQYGSDAIAGVINLILRKDLGTEFNTTIGQNYGNDGAIIETSVDEGVKLGEKGFFNATLFFRSRGATNKAGIDARQQYFGTNPTTGAQTTLAGSGVLNDYNGIPDPREA